MKLLLSILLMSFISLTEIGVSLMEISSYELCVIDFTPEGETEKESSENSKEDVKIRNFGVPYGIFNNDLFCNNNNCETFSLITHYLEIHSPPPECRL